MANIVRLGGGGTGSSTVTLPPMVTELKAVGSDSTITVTFTNPVSEALAGVMVVYNDNHTPTKPSDGKKVDAGLTQQAVITGLTNGTEYFIRVYPYNEKKQYQTLIDGATTNATPNIGPAQVTNLQVSDGGSNPVLTWVNPPDDPLYHETVVIQKVGSAPTSITDGTEIYRGTGTTVTAQNLERLSIYYFAVFTIDEVGSHRSPVVSDPYSYDFPANPTGYIPIGTYSSSFNFVAPEIGWFKFIAVAGSGNGGRNVKTKYNSGRYAMAGGGGGGSGGIVASVFALNEGESVPVTISGNVSISHGSEVMSAIRGSDGSDGSHSGLNGVHAYGGSGGSGGYASGGNLVNQPGIRGGSGDDLVSEDTVSLDSLAGYAVTNSYEGYSTTSAKGGEKNATAAYVVILRGNTNIPSPTRASTLSLTPRNTSIEAIWTNSGDPESVGTILVSNTDHAPVDYTDGNPVDMADATSYTVTDLPNDKPAYISLFAYNADKTKYSAALSDMEIPREVTWADAQDDLEEELAQTSEDLAENQIMVASAASTLSLLIISDIQNETEIITDNMILDNADILSNEWETGIPNEVGDIVWYMIGDVKQYYKIIQPTDNADPNHTPNIVPAVFVPINRSNAGTIDDPIPAVRGMEYEYGKYYLDNEDGNIYLCKRGEETGTIVLQYLPHELVGQYFELTTSTDE